MLSKTRHLRLFSRVHDQWQALGYPFDRLVPSYASALGSSADRPAALSELMSIIVNDGIKKPTIRFTDLHFGEGTPYESKLERRPAAGKRVMRKEVAQTLRRAIVSVVEKGTARRLGKYPTRANGQEWSVGGKTGTGDNRFEVRNRHGTLIKAIPRNRTATFAFQIDGRFFGALTAYVPGKKSGEYNFTSSLAVSVLGILAEELRPLWWRDDEPPKGPEDDQQLMTPPKHLVSKGGVKP